MSIVGKVSGFFCKPVIANFADNEADSDNIIEGLMNFFLGEDSNSSGCKGIIFPLLLLFVVEMSSLDMERLYRSKLFGSVWLYKE